MERDSLTLRGMIVKRLFLFCGAAWAVVRFVFLYFTLTLELNPGNVLFPGMLLFSFGSIHAVMAAGYILSGFYGRRYIAVIKLLTAGQIFALCADTALVFALVGNFSGFITNYSALTIFPWGLSPQAAVAGLFAADALFLAGLVICLGRCAEESRQPEVPAPKEDLPEVNEVSLEEE